MANSGMILTLAVISALLFALMADYSDWQHRNNINKNNADCKEITNTVGVCPVCYQWTSIECKGDVPVWFNAIWIAPVIVAGIVAFLP